MPPPPVDEKSKSEPVTTNPSTTRIACRITFASDVRTPELAATATDIPCFWKKRMTSAVVATVPPMRPVKLSANCSATTGTNGIGDDTAPVSAIAAVTCGSNDSRATATLHWRLGRLQRAPQVDVGELVHDDVEAEERRRGHHELAERHAMELRQLGRLRADQRRAARSQLVEELPVVRERASSRGRQRGRLHQRQQLDEPLVPDPAQRRRGRALDADSLCRRDEQLHAVACDALGPRRRRPEPEVTKAVVPSARTSTF